ncbi:MAG: hypothetical protein HY819_00770 [Acidobacteria bacterium]|nr:hypothetical protein [Acidobacteriota bacterium]
MKKNTLILITLSLMLLISLGYKTKAFQDKKQTPSLNEKPLNLDLEEGQVGEIPKDWRSPGKGYLVKLVEETPKSGKRCAVVFNDGEVSPENFGNVMQSIDATAFRGKRVKFRGSVKINSDSGGRAQLWFRVNLNENTIGFFDNMGDRPIYSSEWKPYEIVADIDQNAQSINFGMLLLGKGKAWLDEVSFEEIGQLTYLKEPARPLTEQGLTNVMAFTKLFGYVRHFHPSDEAANINWDGFAVKNIKVVEEAKNNTELAERLNSIFAPIAPTVKVFPTSNKPELSAELKTQTSNAKITYWQHTGFGSTKQNNFSPYRSFRKQEPISDKTPDPSKPFIGDLGAGLSCIVPTALFIDEKGTLPHINSNSKSDTDSLIKYSGNDRSTRLADVIVSWNIMQHFYPYFDVVKVDWAKTLEKTLVSAANDKDASAFAKTLSLMIADLQDGHGGVGYAGEQNFFAPPVLCDWIEEKLVITDLEPNKDTQGLQAGDIIISVDGKASKELLAEKEAMISSPTPQWKRFNALRSILSGKESSQVTLEVQTINKEKKTISLKRTDNFYLIKEQRPEKVAEVKPGIFYLDIDRITDADFTQALPKLEKAKGIIFDLRGYPNQISAVILHHLTDQPIESARWNIPIVSTPDHQNMKEFNTDGRWKLEPKSPRLKAKTAFITDGRAISYAESYMGVVEAYKLAEIVGATTAGTNGNINPIKLLGDYTVVWTGMKVLKHDGSQHHGVGIKPTIPVSRTLKGVAEKRDEFLEKAIEVVSQ